ncbi:MAG: hypothetical protein Q9162_005169 [Coniocarpon cinnabarinum]
MASASADSTSAFEVQARTNRQEPEAEFAYDSALDSDSTCSTCSSTESEHVKPALSPAAKPKKRTLEQSEKPEGAEGDFEWSKVKRTSDTSDSSSSSDGEDLAAFVHNANIKSDSEDEDPTNKPGPIGRDREKDEKRWPRDYLPKFPEIIDVQELEIHKAGHVQSISYMWDLEAGWLMLIKAVEGLSKDPTSTAERETIKADRPLTLDYGSVLCTENRVVLGAIGDVIGRVGSPSYALCFLKRETIEEHGLKEGSEIYYFPKYAQSVFPGQLSTVGRASDASGLADREAEEERAFSDDEKERYYTSRGRKGTRGGIMEKVKLEIEEWNAEQSRRQQNRPQGGSKKARNDFTAPKSSSLPAGPPAFGSSLPSKPPASAQKTSNSKASLPATPGAPNAFAHSHQPASFSGDLADHGQRGRGFFRSRGPGRGRGRGAVSNRGSSDNQSPMAHAHGGHGRGQFRGGMPYSDRPGSSHIAAPPRDEIREDLDMEGGYKRLRRPLDYGAESHVPPPVTQSTSPPMATSGTPQQSFPAATGSYTWNGGYRPPATTMNFGHAQGYGRGGNNGFGNRGGNSSQSYNQMQQHYQGFQGQQQNAWNMQNFNWGLTRGQGAQGWTSNEWIWNGFQYVRTQPPFWQQPPQ